jgi:uncharacterized membrane protein
MANEQTTLARGLGWFSIGLGVAQVAAPTVVGRLVGVRPTSRSRDVMRAIGVRELVAGAGLIAERKPPAFLWARVAGDAMDLALLGNVLGSDGDRRRTAAAAAAVAGVTALDVLAATAGSQIDEDERSAVDARSAITVNAPPEAAYAAWRDFEALPSFMYHLKSVQVTADGCSHWVAKAPAGTTVEWDAETVDDVPGQRISWRSAPGSSVENAGTVEFRPAPGGRGTEIHVELRYQPPGGAIGAVVAKLFGEEPNQQLADDLRRFKQLLETGEIARSDGSPLGTRTQNQLHQEDAHPAQGPSGPTSGVEEKSA